MTAPEIDARRVSATRSHVPGEPGVWILIIGDLIVFGVIFLAFLHARGGEPAVFEESQVALHRAFGVLNTLLLLTSSLFVASAVAAMRPPAAGTARRFLFAALACAVMFLVDKGIEWTDLITGGHGATSNAYFMYFFVMTGLHAVHVVLGVILLIAMTRIARAGKLTKSQIDTVESFGCCWHLVDVLWLIIFPLLYLMH